MPRLRLLAGPWETEILPEHGAAMALLRHGGRDLIVPIPDGALPGAGLWGAFWMIPWANRIDGGRIPLGDAVHRVPVNRVAEDTAIHGLARDRPFRVESAGAGRLVLSQRLEDPALPMRYRARIAIALGEDALRIEVALANIGADPFPFGLGWHPFFPRPAGTRLRFAAATLFARDARVLPEAPRDIAGIDGDEGLYLGMDSHIAGWDGVAEIAWPGGPTLQLRAEGAWRGNLQLFAPPQAEVLCLEPQSHVPDVVNRTDFARFGPMAILAPGERLDAALALAVG
jgi:aldose 1-epimerase